jgi:hypothetical protein
MMRRDGLFRETAKQQLDDAIHATRTIAQPYSGVPPAYERLVRHVLARSNLLHPSDRAGDNRIGFNAGLLALSLYYGDWLRPVETRNPAKQNPWPQFNALAQHLLARYPVPAFMTSAWLDLPPRRKAAAA